MSEELPDYARPPPSRNPNFTMFASQEDIKAQFAGHPGVILESSS